MIEAGNLIGTLVKIHGYQGDLVISGEKDQLDKLEIGTTLFIEINGQLVPFFLEDISTDPKGKRAVIALQFITSDIEARRFINCRVFTEGTGQGEVQPHLAGLVGFKLIDGSSGLEFEISDYIENPQNPLLVFRVNKEEAYLPLKADYIKEVRNREKIILAELPEGLLPDDDDFTTGS